MKVRGRRSEIGGQRSESRAVMGDVVDYVHLLTHANGIIRE